jgi:hypothetical protein
MHAWIKKIHMYLGLLNFVAITVFGVAGLTATMQPGPGRPPAVADSRDQPFRVRADATDKQVADDVFEALNIPLSNPLPTQAIRRNDQNQLVLNFYTINGPYRVTVLEKEARLRVERMLNSTPRFLSNAHSVTQAGNSRYLRVRLWGWYNEFAIWSLLGMSISGVYLWLASRPGYRWAQVSFAAGTVVFIALYAATR